MQNSPSPLVSPMLSISLQIWPTLVGFIQYHCMYYAKAMRGPDVTPTWASNTARRINEEAGVELPSTRFQFIKCEQSQRDETVTLLM
jgi:hypothetical protein